MMQSILKNQTMHSPLQSTSTLKPKGSSMRRSLVFTLTLTSLIDAFSILVIYLLINFSPASGTINVDKNLQLPMAEKSNPLDKGTSLVINSGHYFIDNQEIPFASIVGRLVQLREASKDQVTSLIIQADKKLDYAQLSPVILAGAHAGFQQFKFAVIQGGSAQ